MAYYYYFKRSATSPAIILNLQIRPQINFPGITTDTFYLFVRFCYLRQLTAWNPRQDEVQTRHGGQLTVNDPVELVALADELCLPELLCTVESVVANQMNCRDECVYEAASLYDILKVTTCIEYSVRCTVYGVQCTMYSMLTHNYLLFLY